MDSRESRAGVIKSVFNFALDRELVAVDPTARCPSNPENPRKRELSDDEIRQFWRAFDTQPTAMEAGFRLRLLTGQRGGEVFNMEWRDLDLDAGWWTIPGDKTKNGKAHRVPLSAPALEIIKAIAVEKGARVKKGKVLGRYVLEGARGRRQRGDASRATEIAAGNHRYGQGRATWLQDSPCGALVAAQCRACVGGGRARSRRGSTRARVHVDDGRGTRGTRRHLSQQAARCPGGDSVVPRVCQPLRRLGASLVLP